MNSPNGGDNDNETKHNQRGANSSRKRRYPELGIAISEHDNRDRDDEKPRQRWKEEKKRFQNDRFAFIVALAIIVSVFATLELVVFEDSDPQRGIENDVVRKDPSNEDQDDAALPPDWFLYANEGERTPVPSSTASSSSSVTASSTESSLSTTTTTTSASVASADSTDDRGGPSFTADATTTTTVATTTMTVRERQIRNYRDGTALMLNVHAVHHGGTSFCARIGRHGIRGDPAPAFACMGDSDGVLTVTPELCDADASLCGKKASLLNEIQKFDTPWRWNQTGPFIDLIRPRFHMISWEFRGVATYDLELNGRTLEDPDWDHPRLLSVVVTRDPVARMMAGDGEISVLYPGIDGDAPLGRVEWWNYAAYDDRPQTDNLFLRILLAKDRPKRTPEQRSIPNHASAGAERTTDELLDLFPTDLDASDFERAKALLGRFTVVLDIACLDDGMDALGRLLGLDLPPRSSSSSAAAARRSRNNKRPSNRERIGHDDVYEYLSEKNRWDIALYEYSKTISLVRCDDDENENDEHDDERHLGGTDR